MALAAMDNIADVAAPEAAHAIPRFEDSFEHAGATEMAL